MGVRELVVDGARAVRRATRGRSKLVAAGSAVGAVVAGAAAAVMARRRRNRLAFPDPAVLGAETGSSIHNAAKATVITAVRQAEHPDEVLVIEAVGAAMDDARHAGVDVVLVAVGAVEGATQVAHLIGVSARDLADIAARAALDAAAGHGVVAAERVEEYLDVFIRD